MLTYCFMSASCCDVYLTNKTVVLRMFCAVKVKTINRAQTVGWPTIFHCALFSKDKKTNTKKMHKTSVFIALVLALLATAIAAQGTILSGSGIAPEDTVIPVRFSRAHGTNCHHVPAIQNFWFLHNNFLICIIIIY